MIFQFKKNQFSHVILFGAALLLISPAIMLGAASQKEKNFLNNGPVAEPAAGNAKQGAGGAQQPGASAVELSKKSGPLAAWAQPRELSSFQSLLQHSPFSLATAEESSPLSERYSVTGIITLDGEEQVFVLDRNDQSRELLTKKPNKKSMSLINVIKDTDPTKLKATIQVNGETGIITSLEPSTNAPAGGPPRFNGPGFPGGGNNSAKNTFHPPGANYYPGQPAPNAQHLPSMPSNFNNPNNHRVITRPPIPGQ